MEVIRLPARYEIRSTLSPSKPIQIRSEILRVEFEPSSVGTPPNEFMSNLKKRMDAYYLAASSDNKKI